MVRICKLTSCGNEFVVPSDQHRKVYCSRSCSTTSNNLASPRRRKTKVCAGEGCSTLILSSHKFCGPECSKIGLGYLDRTVGELRDSMSGGPSYNARLRQVARQEYRLSGKPFRCHECGYNLHVDIAHVRDVSAFSDDELVRDTCSVDNLVALCKTHHWEFDHGYLEVLGVLKPLRPSSNSELA